MDDRASSVTCEHCGSLLLLEAPDREELCVAEGRLREAKDLAEVVVEYRVAAQRAEIIHRYSDSDGNPPPEVFVAMRLRAYEKKLRAAVRVGEARLLHVPYWHIAGSIVQGLLGRAGDLKQTRVRSFAAEHTVPGYDTGLANLRDRGLRLDQSRARPLHAEAVAAHPAFLPRVPLEEARHREIEKWLGRDLDPSIETIARHAAFLFERRLLVYRPYWIARVVTDRGPEWILFDAGFATIAGYPSEPEVRALLRLRDKDPLRARSDGFRRVHVLASRCPDCGHEQAVERDAVVTVCPNCHLGLRLTPAGLEVFAYAHAAPAGADLDADYLPFWRARFRAKLPNGQTLLGLDAYARFLFPKPPPGFALAGEHLLIPALRLLGSEPGDSAFKDLAEWLHGAPPAVSAAKVPLGGRPRFHAATLPWKEALQLAPFVLLALHGRASAARLSTLSLRKAVRDLTLPLEGPELVMLPLARAGEELASAGGEVRLPALLLEEGPRLRALRASVQQAVSRIPDSR